MDRVTFLALAALTLTAPRARAHDYPISPVLVALRVEPDRMVADVDSDSIYWIEEVVGLHPMPPDGWPEAARRAAQDYANAHLRLSADGRRLQGTLLSASYRQGLGQVNEQGRIHLRLAYPALGEAKTLSGEADFFEDYRQERLAEKAPILPFQTFETRLSVPGRLPHEFVLRPGADSFSLPAADARRTRAQRALQSLSAGAARVLLDWSAWPALLALSLSMAPAPGRARAAELAAVALGAALPISPDIQPAWAAGVCAALAAGRWLPAAPALETAALAMLGRAWSLGALSELPGAAPGAAERALAAAGFLAAAAAALGAGALAAARAARGLERESASRAAELFERRRRLAATAIGIVCAAALLGGR